jgi:hypothetical protein
MLITHAKIGSASATAFHPAMADVSVAKLRSTVEQLNYPRHYVANRAANEQARDWLVEELRCLGYDVRLQGQYDNVIAESRGKAHGPRVLFGAHYDTVPTTPGADDNNSAIAVCLEVARVLAAKVNGREDAVVPLTIAIFNREEDGLLGSTEYVGGLGAEERKQLREAHIFEMVGYFTTAPGSQGKPKGLPVSLPDQGNFIGLVSNAKFNRIASKVLRAVGTWGSRTPLVSLKVLFGLEKVFGDLLRSDHTPFWKAGLPALMWTDTSNFRNPHYHLPSDLPETLDYEAMADVTKMVVGYLVGAAGGSAG